MSCTKRTALAGVAALRLVTGQSHNQLVYIKFQGTEGDGGEGWFMYDVFSNENDDGGSLYVKPASINSDEDGRWVRQS